MRLDKIKHSQLALIVAINSYGEESAPPAVSDIYQKYLSAIEKHVEKPHKEVLGQLEKQ